MLITRTNLGEFSFLRFYAQLKCAKDHFSTFISYDKVNLMLYP